LHLTKKNIFKKSHFWNNSFRKFDNSFFVDHLDVERTHINQNLPSPLCLPLIKTGSRAL
jgi:hypothetical protein